MRRALSPAAVRLAAWLSGAWLLGACVTLPEAQQVESFRLSAPATPAAQTGATARAVPVAVEQPIAQGALATDRIVVIVDDRVQVVSGARWDERMPEMLNRQIARALQAGGGVDVVDGAQRAGRADFALVTVLESMHVAIGDDLRGEARTEIGARLVRLPGRDIVATSIFSGTAPAPSDDPASLTRAIDAATSAAIRDLVGWVGAQVGAGRSS
ncbi:MAG: hypothetical protein EA355_12100 [Rhodobacteraceae bacterium]|nr:MAG: hypothetical protein EA355_12100 [Paracoccaceae bacterium]